MKNFLCASLLLIASASIAQTSMSGKDNSWKKYYRAFHTKSNDLMHTKLEANFNYKKAQMNGKVWLTLKPHFYATNMLELDAKGMDISAVEMVKSTGKNVQLSYDYSDNLMLKITLDKEYNADEAYTIYINYVAKPNDFKVKGSAAITDAKGLYFINPNGEEKDKPTQIWTQGETEATSVWVPTIDKPNQKSTQEFYLTVPSKYVTLSNGLLISQTKNSDDTRTDYWKMDLPHAPYLFFMGVGDFAVVKDKYKDKEVSYYVEKEYEPAARGIFGLTPEMIQFFSEKVTGVDYPWAKYSQIVGRDYVSGAMENTTATLHQASANQNLRELADGNRWETVIAHELFHQWFGDYVTAESWSNLTVNESFADYSELLWMEYKYGADYGGEEQDNALQTYLLGGSSKKDLVRFYYADKEDMFDAISYQKGGRILHMLRNMVGDDAFFKSLNRYLTNNKFGNGSGHKLRLAFEEVTGKDLNWYFNQWYFNSGHPKLEVSSSYNSADKKVLMVVKQNQDSTKMFKLSVGVDVYAGSNKTRHYIWLENRTDSIWLDAPTKPDLVKFDGDNILLAEIKETKDLAYHLAAYKKAGKYLDRKEALSYAIAHKSEPTAMQLIKDALQDAYPKFRSRAIDALPIDNIDATTLATIENMAYNDKSNPTKAKAIDFLGKLKDNKYKQFFVTSTKHLSYSVAGAALSALTELDEKEATKIADEVKSDAKGKLKGALSKIKMLSKSEDEIDDVIKEFNKVNFMEKGDAARGLVFFLQKVNNIDNFKKGVDKLVKFRDGVAGFMPEAKEQINKLLADLKQAKSKQKTADNASVIDEQIKYIDEKIAD